MIDLDRLREYASSARFTGSFVLGHAVNSRYLMTIQPLLEAGTFAMVSDAPSSLTLDEIVIERENRYGTVYGMRRQLTAMWTNGTTQVAIVGSIDHDFPGVAPDPAKVRFSIVATNGTHRVSVDALDNNANVPVPWAPADTTVLDRFRNQLDPYYVRLTTELTAAPASAKRVARQRIERQLGGHDSANKAPSVETSTRAESIWPPLPQNVQLTPELHSIAVGDARDLLRRSGIAVLRETDPIDADQATDQQLRMREMSQRIDGMKVVAGALEDNDLESGCLVVRALIAKCETRTKALIDRPPSISDEATITNRQVVRRPEARRSVPPLGHDSSGDRRNDNSRGADAAPSPLAGRSDGIDHAETDAGAQRRSDLDYRPPEITPPSADNNGRDMGTPFD